VYSTYLYSLTQYTAMVSYPETGLAQALALAYIHKVAGARACGGKQGIAPGESMYSQETADIMGNTK
jgi:hypothetical protein